MNNDIMIESKKMMKIIEYIIKIKKEKEIMNKSCLRDFDILSKLGQGAFGQVFKVKRRADGKQYALKKVKIRTLKEKDRQNALNQIRIMASYDGQFIIGYKQAFYDENSQTLCIVMEFASQGDLLKKVQTHIKNRSRFPEPQIWKALIHMTKGLKLLHQKKILHRDLKCANIFITSDGTYKLGDLNVSKVLKQELASTQTGTPYYASPQVWKDKPYGPKSDIWSLGCVVYQMAALKPPFTGRDLQGLFKKVCAGIFQRIPSFYSNDLASIISLLLQLDATKRPTAQQLLSNPLIQKKLNGQTIQEQLTNDQLLKTIKYNPKDLKALKNILPKSNYQHQSISSQRKLNTKQNVQINNNNNTNSCKQIKKQSSANIINDQKLNNFIQKKRINEEKQKQIQILQDQKQQLNRKRQRVLSACGVRQSLISESPKIQQHRKDSQNVNKQATNQKNNLPPKQPKPSPSPPNNLPTSPQPKINYHLPPRPSTNQRNSFADKVNQSSEHNNNSQNKQNNKDANIFKQNQQKPPQRQLPRSNSQHRIVIYPSWWG